MREEIEWYLDRINHYRNCIESNSRNEKIKEKRYRLYGDLEEYVDFKGIRQMHEFWIDSMNWFIEDRVKKDMKNTSKTH